MHPSCKASGKKRYIPQAAKCPSLSCSVSLLEPNMSDKTKVQRWTLFLGGDGIGKKKKKPFSTRLPLMGLSTMIG